MTTTGTPSTQNVTTAAGTPGRTGAARAAVAITVVSGAAALPFALTPYQTGLASQILIFGILAKSIDLLAGLAGRTSLAHGAIFGVAAYVVMIIAVLCLPETRGKELKAYE